MADVVLTSSAAFIGQVERMLDRKLGAAVRELRDRARQRVATPYPPASAPLTPPHRRTGGLQSAIFARKLGPMEWAFGVDSVGPDPERPGANRERLGLWMELGTGVYRSHPDGSGGVSSSPSPIVRSSVERRPYLLPTLVEDGRAVVIRHLGTAAEGVEVSANA